MEDVIWHSSPAYAISLLLCSPPFSCTIISVSVMNVATSGGNVQTVLLPEGRIIHGEAPSAEGEQGVDHELVESQKIAKVQSVDRAQIQRRK